MSSPWALIHLGLIFVSLVIFVASLVSGVLYLLREGRIKGKKGGGWMDRLPSLERLDRIHYRALYAGFVFFTFGIITGGGWSKSVYGVYLTGDRRQLASLLLWFFYALLLNLRVPRGWMGRKGILLSCFGFAAMIFLLVGFL